MDESLKLGLACLSKPVRGNRFQFFRLLDSAGLGGNLATDALIAATASEHGGCVYTNDRDVGRFANIAWRNPLADPGP